MGIVDHHQYEQARLDVLRETGLLDSPPEQAFELIVDLARELIGCKYASVSLIDADRQWFKAERGLGTRETPREYAFCATAVEQNELLIVTDAASDPRFARFPQVTGPMHLRFYMGIPLHAHARGGGPDMPLGTLCVLDDTRREPTEYDLATLRRLAHLAEALIRPRAVALKAAELMAQHRIDIVQLTRAHRRLQQTERMADIGSWRLEFADRRIIWSDGVFAIHGLPPGTPPSLECALDFYPVQSRAQLVAALERGRAEGTSFDLEVDFLTAQGDERRVRVVGEREMLDGEPLTLIGAIQDVTVRYRTEQALRRSAAVDDLTGLTNRAGFNAILDERLVQAAVTGEPLALALIDLDGFKAVNDRCGHLKGDEVLQAIARRLARPHRAGCALARLGGDEFVLLLDFPPDSTAFHAAVESLLADLRLEVACETETLAVSGTIGISRFDGASSRRDLLNRADQALYAAKRQGRGTARLFGSELVFGTLD